MRIVHSLVVSFHYHAQKATTIKGADSGDHIVGP